MANVGDTLPHCTGTGTQADPYIFSDAQGFVEAIAVNNSYIEAGTDSIEMDADDGIITEPLIFNGNKINGKGTTIYNLTLSSAAGELIRFLRTCKIENMNFYNMALLPSGNDVKILKTETAADTGYTVSEQLINCNFAGIIEGNSAGLGLIETRRNNSTWKSSYAFASCTFNFNFRLTATATVDFFKTNSYDGIALTDCTLSLTGNVNVGNGNSFRCGTSYVKFNKCTFLSNENKLTVAQTFSMTPTNDGYNYFFMPVEADTVTITDAKTLVNRSYITATTKNLSGSISMQQDDSAADDYIFDESNLQAKGFVIGRVIR